jgi:hypothetical protein
MSQYEETRIHPVKMNCFFKNLLVQLNPSIQNIPSWDTIHHSFIILSPNPYTVTWASNFYGKHNFIIVLKLVSLKRTEYKVLVEINEGKRTVEGPMTLGKKGTKTERNGMKGCGLDSYGSGWGPMLGAYGHSN